MIDMVLWVLAGIVIGWHVPQPMWAAGMFSRVRGWFTS